MNWQSQLRAQPRAPGHIDHLFSSDRLLISGILSAFLDALGAPPHLLRMGPHPQALLLAPSRSSRPQAQLIRRVSVTQHDRTILCELPSYRALVDADASDGAP